jgi:hypothetical protein
MEQTVQSTKQWTETKELRKARKAREKALTELAQLDQEMGLLDVAPSSPKNYVVCLKWGNKYSAEYVNKLNNMVKRNLTIDYEFVCFTENAAGIDKDIRIEPLPPIPATGWWFKPYFMSDKLPLRGTLLYLDLDLIVFDNIDKLFTYNPNKDFLIIRDFNRQVRKNWDRVNSSVFRLKIGSKYSAYEQFLQERESIVRRMPGDQDWMYRYCKPYEYWPDEWIQSYKWEMRGRNTLGVVNGKRNFVQPGEPTILPETSIAVFHGKPDIPEALDEWPRKNWY